MCTTTSHATTHHPPTTLPCPQSLTLLVHELTAAPQPTEAATRQQYVEALELARLELFTLDCYAFLFAREAQRRVLLAGLKSRHEAAAVWLGRAALRAALDETLRLQSGVCCGAGRAAVFACR